MHFLFPRRQRRWQRTGNFATFAKSTTWRKVHKAPSRVATLLWSFCWDYTTSNLRGGNISQVHYVRNGSLAFLNEMELLDRYFQSQEDPWMKEAIAEHCSNVPDLAHITERYLEKMSKLKLFL